VGCEAGAGCCKPQSLLPRCCLVLPGALTCSCAGAGLDDAGVAGKQQAVAAALAANSELLLQQGGTPAQQAAAALRAVGGLELAAMAGAYLTAAQHRIPAVVDGFISGAAALAALAIEPEGVGRVLFLSHSSAERGAALLSSALAAGVRAAAGVGAGPGRAAAGGRLQQPVLDMQLRLGEGTGAVLCLPLLRAAAAVASDMASLDEAMAL
jgi:nicotinate-nucleotide--dimethylbenzimidazole phosphoribosyltransferase